MCYGIYHTHSQCGHDKIIEIIDYCEDFEKGTCMLIPIHFKLITAPSLCISCFREKEANIDALYHGKVQMTRSKIAEYEAAQAERQIRGRARGTVDPNVAKLEQDLVEAGEWRKREIKKFRVEQDVWADG